MIAPDAQGMEIRLLEAVDGAFAAARRRAGAWIVCQAGCDDCCRRPFAITAADARRLQAGLRELDDETRAEIRQRAAEVREAIALDFPGDWASGALTDRPEWREWFFARHAGLACPVLDLETGECRLYEHRPVACRLAGPLIQIGDGITDPCGLCFSGASAGEIESTKIALQASEFRERSEEAETLVALSL